MNNNKKIIFGIDLSLNHWAICKIDYMTGKCLDYRYLTNKKKEYNKNVANAFLLKVYKKNNESKENYDEMRRAFSFDALLNYMFIDLRLFTKDIYVCIEGYAFAAASRSICQIAEFTGLLKAALYEYNAFVRIHDPLTVKLYATGKGNCLKKDVVLAARSSGFNISQSLVSKKNKKTSNGIIEEYDGVATDLADSYFLARVLRTELMLREGIEDLKNLTEKERHIFLRVTKAYPENILSRQFIHKKG